MTEITHILNKENLYLGGKNNMNIANNIIREHLKNVYFLCGGAYGGKL